MRRMEGMLAGEFNALKNGIPAAVIDAAPEGPDDEQRRQGKWTITVEAVSDGGRTIRGEVEGTDGYGKTTVIAVEAARRLVADGAKLGVLTPAQRSTRSRSLVTWPGTGSAGGCSRPDAGRTRGRL